MVEMQNSDTQRSSDRRVKRTKRAIHDAVLKLLNEEDLDRITVTAVAREADIDRKTFYLHYASVDEVLDEIIREDVEGVMGMWRSEVKEQSSLEETAKGFTSASILIMQSIELNGQMLDHMDADQLLSKVEAPLIDSIVEDDTLGLASALGPQLPYAVSFFCSGLLAVLRRWLKEDSEIPLEELISMSSTAIVAGIEGILIEAGQEPPAAEKVAADAAPVAAAIAGRVQGAEAPAPEAGEDLEGWALRSSSASEKKKPAPAKGESKGEGQGKPPAGGTGRRRVTPTCMGF